MASINTGYVFGIAAALIWSGFILVSRLGGLSELNAYDVIAIRYATCAVLLFPFWFFAYRFNLLKPKFVVIALIGGLGYAVFTFKGFQLAPASHAALLLPGAMPLFALMLTYLLKTENVSTQKWIGVSIITGGILLLFFDQLTSIGEALIGDLLFLGGALSWTMMSILIKRWNITPWELTVCLAFFTCALYMPIYWVFLPKNIGMAHASDIATQMVYQGFLATIVQMLLFAKAVHYLGAASMGSLMAIVPLVSGVGAFWLLNEPANPTLLSGLALVALGAWISNTNTLLNIGTKLSVRS